MMSKLKKKANTILFCDGKKCCRYNEEAKKCMKELLILNGLEGEYRVEKMKCQGMCKKGPIVYLPSEDVYKKEVSKKKAEKIFKKYFASMWLSDNRRESQNFRK